MPEARGPVDSPAYQWFVRFKYMPIVARLDEWTVCWHDLQFAFGAKEVSFMFDTALMKVSEVGSYTCALESVEDERRFMQIRFLGQFVRQDLISQVEAEDIFAAQAENVNMLGMKWVSRSRTNYVMPKSLGV